MNLNAEQKLAVAHHNGPCVVTAVPGSGKCITGDSLVFSDIHFLSPIRDDNISSVLGLHSEELNTVEIETNEIGTFVDSGVKPVIQIDTHHGFSIRGTKHHPIVVLNNDGNLEWQQLSDIRVGSVAAIWSNKNCESYAVADGMDYSNFPRGLNHNNLDYSFYLMGLLLGDGSLSVPKSVSFCCQSELKSVFLFLIKRIYGERVSEYRDKRREELWNLYVYNKVKSKLISQFGDIEHGSCNKYLTCEMLSGDKSQVAALIRGLFDTDGYAGECACEITLCSKKLINQLHLLLLHFGIFSYKKTKVVNDNEYYRIQIHGEDYRRFVRNIGFGVSYKKERSKMILQKTSNPNKVIPHMKSVLKRLRGEIRDFSWWDGRTATIFSDTDSVCMKRYLIDGNHSRDLTETSALKIVDICESNNFHSETVSYLRGIAENLCFSPVEYESSIIESIEVGGKNVSLPEEHVFDYEVPKSHSFIANGFINHNTFVLTERVISLIRDRGIVPRSILCLTFTNKAANEMKERVAHVLPDQNIWISTFHKLCLAILRKHGSLIDLAPNFTIYTSREQDELMGKIARMHDYDSTRASVQKLTRAVNDFREDIVDFEKHLGELTPIEAEIVKEYQDTLDDLNVIDFSGMLYKAWLILKNNPRVIEGMTKRFKYVLVDEFQDTNHIQYDIVKRLSPHGNLFVVADGNQSIYKFRGAKPENLKLFITDFNASTITLPRNYRSTAPILEVAERLIRNNDNATDVRLISERGSGTDVTVKGHGNADQESDYLVYNIVNLRNTYGYDWKDFAVLYRMNSLSRSPEIELRNRGIPYTVLGGFSFFDRAEIKTTLSYLSLLVNPYDTINFARAVSNPKRGIGNDTIGKLERVCQQTHEPILDVCRRIDEIPKISVKARANLTQFAGMMDKYTKMHSGGESISTVVDGLLGSSGYRDAVKAIDQKEDEDKSRLENLDEFVAGISEFEKRKPNANIADYLQSIQLLTGDDKDTQEDSVKLLTIHSSKGLEWSCVHIVGVEDGCLPHSRSLSEEKGIEEERRLLYVGITRSRDFLHISYCRNRGYFKKGSRTNIREPSRFILELTGGMHEK